MLYQITQYISFLLRSTNHHGVHSPYVYNLITKCFYNKKHQPAYNKLLAYQKSLYSNTTTISISDLGAGSKVTKNKQRRISSIAKHSGTSFKRSKLLYRLVNYLDCQHILELGTSLGIATQAMSIANTNAQITTIEGCSNIADFTKHQLKNHQLDNINLLHGDFQQHLSKLSKNKYDLIFFDGNHQKEATLAYFEAMLPTVHNDTLFIFDDIYWSKGMTQAWQSIKNHPRVTVTIDTYFWGIVSFRKEQQKEHFTIRV